MTRERLREQIRVYIFDIADDYIIDETNMVDKITDAILSLFPVMATRDEILHQINRYIPLANPKYRESLAEALVGRICK